MSNENKKEQGCLENSDPVSNDETQKPIATLLGSISYSNEADWENFLNTMSVDNALVILIHGVNYAQSKGSYNLAEAELIAKAIKTIIKLQNNQATEAEEDHATDQDTK